MPFTLMSMNQYSQPIVNRSRRIPHNSIMGTVGFLTVVGTPCSAAEAPPELPPKLSPAGFLVSLAPRVNWRVIIDTHR